MRIGELAAASGLTTKTIHFYEQTGLMPGPPPHPERLPRLPRAGESPARLHPRRPGGRPQPRRNPVRPRPA
ncbi:MerR family DNA-binding transcriptional regulator [Streptomyces pratensis]|uniref:MerR family DNA-binding transcriptional regulator n=1 Tax=Streptomyces pratensis TaxID=1169025 RepID=UPI001EE41C1B|nr:MerR family DNA-binding transcriptional regulator [Streptomyces pratensis]